MTQSLTLNSYAAKGLNIEQTLRAVEGDRLAMRAGKFAAGTTLTVATVALATIETILSAAATIATFPASYFVPERYAAIKTHTADSARTMALAAKRTFGAEIIPANQKVAPQVASSRVQKLQELVKAKATTALQFGKENKTALIASAIAVTVVSAYYFGLFDYAASLVQTAPTPAKNTAKAAINIAQKAAEPVVSPKNLMCQVKQAASTATSSEAKASAIEAQSVVNPMRPAISPLANATTIPPSIETASIPATPTSSPQVPPSIETASNPAAQIPQQERFSATQIFGGVLAGSTVAAGVLTVGPAATVTVALALPAIAFASFIGMMNE